MRLFGGNSDDINNSNLNFIGGVHDLQKTSVSILK
jgi:hypothetical protein